MVLFSYGQDDLLGGQFWAKVRLNSLGGQFNLLDGQMHAQLTCYLPHAHLGLMNFRNYKLNARGYYFITIHSKKKNDELHHSSANHLFVNKIHFYINLHSYLGYERFFIRLLRSSIWSLQ